MPAAPGSQIRLEPTRFVRVILPEHFDGGVGELVDELGAYLLPFFRGGVVICADDEDTGYDDNGDDCR